MEVHDIWSTNFMIFIFFHDRQIFWLIIVFIQKKKNSDFSRQDELIIHKNMMQN